MRTTVNLADDVAAAVEQRRRDMGVGLSEAINDLVRAGLVELDADREPFVQQTHDMGSPLIDIRNIGEALEVLEGPFAR